MRFRTKALLRVYRYVFLFIFIVLPCVLLSLVFDSSLVKRSDIVIHVSFCLALLIAGIVLTHKFFWEKMFATLTVLEFGVCWKCPFRKSIFLKFDDCCAIGIQSEESANNLLYPFVYFSTKPYPVSFLGKINKLHCSENFVKFWYSEELYKYLVSILPGEKTGKLAGDRIQLKRRLRDG